MPFAVEVDGVLAGQVTAAPIAEVRAVLGERGVLDRGFWEGRGIMALSVAMVLDHLLGPGPGCTGWRSMSGRRMAQPRAVPASGAARGGSAPGADEYRRGLGRPPEFRSRGGGGGGRTRIRGTFDAKVIIEIPGDLRGSLDCDFRRPEPTRRASVTGATSTRIPLNCGNRDLGADGARGDSRRVPSAVPGWTSRVMRLSPAPRDRYSSELRVLATGDALASDEACVSSERADLSTSTGGQGHEQARSEERAGAAHRARADPCASGPWRGAGASPRRRLPSRRRRLHSPGVLLGLVVVCALTALPWWSLAVPGALLLVSVGAGRRAARASAALDLRERRRITDLEDELADLTGERSAAPTPVWSIKPKDLRVTRSRRPPRGRDDGRERLLTRGRRDSRRSGRRPGARLPQ